MASGIYPFRDQIATMPHPATEGGACMEKAMTQFYLQDSRSDVG